jgi:pimeloyl-ACP methyl ester carboxylesterase
VLLKREGIGMIIKTFGNRKDKKIVFIHGMAMEGLNYYHFEQLLPNSYLIIPTLDGHYAENKTSFISLNDQVDKIICFLNKNNIDELFCIVGTSLGALIAFEIFKKHAVNIKKIIFDGGPFFRLNYFQQYIFKMFVYFIIFVLRNTQGNFLYPKSLLPVKSSVVNYSNFATREDIKNIAKTVFNLEIPVPLNKGNTELIFLYGSRENALKSMKRFHGIDGYRLVIKDHMGHCQLVTNFPEELVKLIV